MIRAVLILLVLAGVLLFRKRLSRRSTNLLRWLVAQPRRTYAAGIIVAAVAAVGVTSLVPLPSGGGGSRARAAAPTTPTPSPRASRGWISTPYLPDPSSSPSAQPSAQPSVPASADSGALIVAGDFLSAFLSAPSFPDDAAWRAELNKHADPGLIVALNLVPRAVVPAARLTGVTATDQTATEVHATGQLDTGATILVTVRQAADGSGWQVYDYKPA